MSTDKLKISSYTPIENLFLAPLENYATRILDKAIETNKLRKKDVLLILDILSKFFPGDLPKTRARVSAAVREILKESSRRKELLPAK